MADKNESQNIRKLTPEEQAKAERLDRRRAWDKKMEKRGFKRTSIMVHESGLDEVKALVREINQRAAGADA